MNFVAWDIEITKAIPSGTDDWTSLRPLGISCAATLDSDGKMRVWHGVLQDEVWAPQMSPDDCREMLYYLAAMQGKGYRIVTWNGLGFDFNILAEECQQEVAARTCERVALAHTDIAFAMLCDLGYMIGLDTAAKGLGVDGKTDGMSGANAPTMWAGDKECQEKVLEYVQQDVRATANVYKALLETRRLYWTTKKGTRCRRPWRPARRDGHLLRVRDALEIPEPDTRWMTRAWPRSKFHGWIEEANLLRVRDALEIPGPDTEWMTHARPHSKFRGCRIIGEAKG